MPQNFQDTRAVGKIFVQYLYNKGITILLINKIDF